MLFTLLMSFNYQGSISYEHQALAEDCWQSSFPGLAERLFSGLLGLTVVSTSGWFDGSVNECESTILQLILGLCNGQVQPIVQVCCILNEQSCILVQLNKLMCKQCIFHALVKLGGIQYMLGQKTDSALVAAAGQNSGRLADHSQHNHL